MKHRHLFSLFCFVILPAFGFSQSPASDSVYMFSYFRGNGEDGLHLAWSEDGMHWKAIWQDSSLLTPRVGQDRLMRDPCIIAGPDGTFHMVWTVSWGEKGIGYARSRDLIQWSEQQYIPVMEHETDALNCWAPEIVYDRKQQRFMLYWSTTIPGRFPGGEGKGDEKYNHRMYYTTTRDFKEFSPTRLLYNQGFNVIDGSILRHEGSYYMLLKDETRYPAAKNIRIAQSDALTGPYGKPSAPITGSYWAEGPTATRIGNRWVVYFDKYTEHQMGAVASEDLHQWQDISDQISFPEGTRHGTVFKASRRVLEKLLKNK